MAEGKLKEVEDDAIRIQTKRFKEQIEDNLYEQEKLEQAEAKTQDKKGK